MGIFPVNNFESRIYRILRISLIIEDVFGLKFRVIREWITLNPFFRRCVYACFVFFPTGFIQLNLIWYHSNHKNQKNHSSDKKQFLHLG